MLAAFFDNLRWLLDQAFAVSAAATAFWTGLGFFTGGISAALLNKRNLFRNHNFAAISELTQSSSQAAAYSKVLRVIANHPAPEIPIDEIKKDTALEEQVLVILGMYQFLAVAVDQRLIDRKLVRKQFLPSMRSTVQKLNAVIDDYRDKMARPKVWSELVRFVERDGRRWRLTKWVLPSRLWFL